jgi:hypothetical protein
MQSAIRINKYLTLFFFLSLWPYVFGLSGASVCEMLIQGPSKTTIRLLLMGTYLFTIDTSS